MTTTYPCPVCGAPADLTAGCANCGRGPDPMAADVVRLNAELAELTPRVDAAHRAYAELAAELRAKRQRRDDLATAVRQSAFLARGGLDRPGAATVATTTATAAAAAERQPRVEAKPVTVQNLLFVLGGLLVGTAAIVFTGVAWAAYGPVGRSVALAAVTLLALAVPPLAARRGLRATAETFAAVGMLLVVLDGYGAWYVDLFGLGSVPGAAYAAGVGVVTALVGLGYGAATGLLAPRFAALVAGQPVLPLLAAELEAGAWGWAFAFAGTTALDLVILLRLRSVGLRVAGWVAYGCAQLATGVCALGALLGPAPSVPVALIGGPVLVAAALLVAAGAVARSGLLRTVGTAAVFLAAGAAIVRPVAEVRIEQTDLAATVAVLVLAAAVWLVPASARLGARIGALAAAGLWGSVLFGMAASAVGVTVAGSFPIWTSSGPEFRVYGWEIPLWITAVTAAVVVLLPAAGRWVAAIAGATLVVLVLPVAVVPGVWPVVVTDLIAVGLLLLVVRRRAAAIAAAVVAAHLAVVGLAQPATAAVTFAGLAVLGLAAGSLLRGTIAGRTALGAGLAAVPAAAAATVFAAGADQPWPARAGLVASALLLLPLVVLAGRGARPYALAALAGTVTVAALWPDLTDVGDPTGLYPALAVVVLAAAYRIVRPAGGPLLGAAAAVNGLALLVVMVPLALVLFVAPYGWLDSAWSGRPPGTGLDPADWAGVPMGSAVAALLLTAAAGLVRRWSLALAAGAVAVVAVLAGGDVAWPAVPAASLVIGLAALVAVALRGTRPAGPAAPSAAAANAPTGPARPAVPSVAPTDVPSGPAVSPGPAGPAGSFGPTGPAGSSGPSGPAVPLAAATNALAGPAAPSVAAGNGPAGPMLRRPAGAAPMGGRIGLWPAAVVGVLLAAAGLAGLLPTAASTLAGLGLVVAAAAVVGGGSPRSGVRVVGWLAGVAAAGSFAVAATRAADLPLARAAYPVLAVAALALGLAALRHRRPAEHRALDAAAWAVAVVAVLLTIGEPRSAAAVCTLWGAAVGARAVAPFETARRWLALGAGASVLIAWWILLAAEQVALPEAYTLPFAVLALATGYLALRARPGLSSWVAYGPGLAAALLPSLASILITDGQYLRRLLLGLGALLVVLAGAREKRQAPFVLGGATLVVVAVHEIVAWDVLPRWGYLALGGLVLIGVAMTYERRLRDLRRLRGALTRMT